MGRTESRTEKVRELAMMVTTLWGGGRDAKLMNGEPFTKRELNRPKQAYYTKPV